MNIKTTSLYPSVVREMPRHIVGIIVALAAVVPLNAIGTDPAAPYEQEFVLTAYYSPLPGQCCYVKGGYVADKILNGEGHTGADGTAVYPGMLAAPAQYAFGTRVTLPGIGTMTVHDRGGAIRVLEDGTHRLDVWAGFGEEGLARALAFGVRRVTATVYPDGSVQPEEQFALENLEAPVDRLQPFLLSDTNVVGVHPKKGDHSLSVVMLQDQLRDAGYFDRESSGIFGDETEQALAAFNRDFGLSEPSDQLSVTSAAFLLAAARRKDAGTPMAAFVDAEAAPAVISQAQRLLRFLGYYKGRTDGAYGDGVFNAILRFQQEHLLVGDAASPGAGRIGPITTKTLVGAWNRTLVAKRADRYLAIHRISEILAKRGDRLEQFLDEGDGGSQVELLQKLLADRGLFPEEKINGNFGSLTKESVLNYQIAAGIVADASGAGAGAVGPSTLAQLRKEEQMELYRLVRAEGWGVL